MLNFRSQSVPKFLSSQRMSKVTGKQDTFYDIQNDAGYTFKMVTPPCNALFPHLGEGGNNGGKFSQTKETSSIITNLLCLSVDTQFKSEREDYFAFLASNENKHNESWLLNSQRVCKNIYNFLFN